jgi:hypothetical protein|tara:strand:+ start:120 stop:362 length:243 start_codon:yes stop_codon:yes gene_type:complete
MKSGYLYCVIPKCEIEVICIDIGYNLKTIMTNDKVIYLKKVNFPKIIKKKIYKKFKKYILLNNIFSNAKKKELLNYVKQF